MLTVAEGWSGVKHATELTHLYWLRSSAETPLLAFSSRPSTRIASGGGGLEAGAPASNPDAEADAEPAPAPAPKRGEADAVTVLARSGKAQSRTASIDELTTKGNQENKLTC
jgi:hypothetical protein